jgi:hypothetical protein
MSPLTTTPAWRCLEGGDRVEQSGVGLLHRPVDVSESSSTFATGDEPVEPYVPGHPVTVIGVRVLEIRPRQRSVRDRADVVHVM